MANNKRRRRRKRLRRRTRIQRASGSANAVAPEEKRDPRNRWLHLRARGGLRLGWRGTGHRIRVLMDETAPAQLLASLAGIATAHLSTAPDHTPLTPRNGRQHESDDSNTQ